MNFNDPELILVKRFRGQAKSYFQISAVSESAVELNDIVHGSFFTFPRKQLEKYINDGVLITSQKNEVPDALLITPLTAKKTKPRQSSNDAKEMKRRYKYVKAALDSSIPAYTEKWLEPWLPEKAKLFDDPTPPNWRTLARWIHIFVESGWNKKALVPAHSKKGCRTTKIDTEIANILDSVVREYLKKIFRVNYLQAHHEFLKRVEQENKNRAAQGLENLKPSSYRTTVYHFKHMIHQ